MKILITGSEGFIARNLITILNQNREFKILKINKKSSEKKLEENIKNSDIIFHLAGVNRPKKKIEFEYNYKLTKKIADELIKLKKKTPIIFSSTIQIKNKNNYGISKLKSEKKLIDLNKKNKNKICIYRLPNVFGKWSRPNYNSVVATFCVDVLNKKKSLVNESNIIELVYIDDLIENFLELITNKNWKSNKNKKIKISYKVKIGEIYDYLKMFKYCDENQYIPNFKNEFEKKLHSVYVSYKTISQIKSFHTKSYENKSGKFVEFLKNKNFGQISFLNCKPRETRGMHFHNFKVEKFLIIQGKAQFIYKNISNKKLKKFIATENDNKIIETIPGWAHKIKNVGSSNLILLIWSNEVYDKLKPDTYKYVDL